MRVGIVCRSGFLGTLLVLLMLIAGSGCATAFVGDARIPNGAAGCAATCQQQGLEMAGMVFMGEYSDGCICRVRGAATGAADNVVYAAAGNPATVGVVMQMRRQAERQQQSMTR